MNELAKADRDVLTTLMVGKRAFAAVSNRSSKTASTFWTGDVDGRASHLTQARWCRQRLARQG